MWKWVALFVAVVFGWSFHVALALIVFIAGFSLIFLLGSPGPDLRAGQADTRQETRPDGSLARWTYSVRGAYELELDFDAQTATARMPSACWLDGETYHDGKPFEWTGSIFSDYKFEFTEEQKSEAHTTTNVATVHNNDGSVGTVYMPGKTYFTDRKTGNYSATFTCSPFQSHVVREWPVPATSAQVRCGGKFIRVSTRGSPLSVFHKDAFAAKWAEVKPHLDALTRQVHAKLFEEHNAQKAAEQAERDAQAKAARDKADARYRELCTEHGLAADFMLWNFNTVTGDLFLLLVVDRDGRGLALAEGQQWSGRLAGATAELLREKDGLSVAAVLPDPAFEKEHLKKRRMRFWIGSNEKLALEWCDRINLLGAQVPA
jgi:hypothetical protein